MGDALGGFTRLVNSLGKKNHKQCSNVHTFFTKALMGDKTKTGHLCFLCYWWLVPNYLEEL